MGFYRCVPTQGGGEPTETVLYTNSKVTSDWTSKTVSLSQDASEFDFIRFEYRVSKNLTTEYSTTVKASDVVASNDIAGNKTRIIIGGVYSSDDYYRKITTIYTSSNPAGRVNIGTCYMNGGSTAYNSNIIPIRIVGIKY